MMKPNCLSTEDVMMTTLIFLDFYELFQSQKVVLQFNEKLIKIPT